MVASPFPFIFNFGVITILKPVRSTLLFLCSWFTWLFRLWEFTTFQYSPAGLVLCRSRSILYWIHFFVLSRLSDRPGLPTDLDMVVAVTGMILLLEGTRRALGPPLMVVASVFLLYTFAGPYMPEVIAHKGQSLNKIVSISGLELRGYLVSPWVFQPVLCFCLFCLVLFWNVQVQEITSSK
ncbi:MAG: hypothetical protein CM1200mP30_21930 [Pseudomonadota bacterium]|nr:MAG: hypothetical protein CM1200mP30_21930 [Pseudomonadota bacterium]